MNRRAVLLFSLFLVGCAAGQTIRSGPPVAPVALQEYFKIRRVSGASFSHDDKLVAYMSDHGGRWDVWVQPVGGGKARQITHVQGFVHSYGFSPTRDVLLYEADDGGNELPHIYMTNSLGLEPKDLTPDLPPGARTRGGGGGGGGG
ncbi:MAG: hypothetical protein O6952_00480, partial [Planctomycetota bacterium]|nr:hypothetical protein [Planctomycetota bacterium]